MNLARVVSALLTLLVVGGATANGGSDNGTAAKSGGRSAATLIADFVAHTEEFVPVGPMLLSRCSGKSTSKYFVEWPRHDLCVFTATFDAMGNLVSSDSGVKPQGMEADPSRVKELCNPDELCDDPTLSASSRKGAITRIQFFIQDDLGTDGIMHESEVVNIDPPATTSPCGFRVHVHRDGVPMWELSGHLGGPRTEMAGTVSIGDVWYRPDPPCSN